MNFDEIKKLLDNFPNVNNRTNYTEYLNENRYNKNITIDTSLKKNLNLLFCDQTATGFPMRSIETFIEKNVYPWYSNTHSNNFVGRLMSEWINQSKKIIMKSVNGDCSKHKIIFTGSGSSGAINHLVHMIKPKIAKSIVFVSEMEHYSNYLPWFHLCRKLVIVPVINNTGMIDLFEFEKKLKTFHSQGERDFITSFSGCSNVVGTIQNTTKAASICKKYGSLFFVDCATSAPYTTINIQIPDAEIDGIFVSPHKFPGGVSTPGLLIVRDSVICNKLAYTPNGGTVKYLQSGDAPVYSQDTEIKQNGGTPNIIGIIKIALCFLIKNHFLNDIEEDEHRFVKKFEKLVKKLEKDPDNYKFKNKIEFLNPKQNTNRLPIFSFRIKNIQTGNYHHPNFIVVLLNDLFGITARGGVSCSGVYAEKLLNLNKQDLTYIKDSIIEGRGTPSFYGWTRITLSSIHSENDLVKIILALKYILINSEKYTNFYTFDKTKNIFMSGQCENGICINEK